MKKDSGLTFEVRTSQAIISLASFLAFGITVKMGENEPLALKALYTHGLLWLLDELVGDEEIQKRINTMANLPPELSSKLEKTTAHFLASRFLLKHGGIEGFNELRRQKGEDSRAGALADLRGENASEGSLADLFKGMGAKVATAVVDKDGNVEFEGEPPPKEVRDMLEKIFGKREDEPATPADPASRTN